MWLCDDFIVAWLGSEAFSGVLVFSVFLGVCVWFFRGEI
jgi:hypothetical protein